MFFRCPQIPHQNGGGPLLWPASARRRAQGVGKGVRGRTQAEVLELVIIKVGGGYTGPLLLAALPTWPGVVQDPIIRCPGQGCCSLVCTGMNEWNTCMPEAGPPLTWGTTGQQLLSRLRVPRAQPPRSTQDRRAASPGLMMANPDLLEGRHHTCSPTPRATLCL